MADFWYTDDATGYQYDTDGNVMNPGGGSLPADIASPDFSGVQVFNSQGQSTPYVAPPAARDWSTSPPTNAQDLQDPSFWKYVKNSDFAYDTNLSASQFSTMSADQIKQNILSDPTKLAALLNGTGASKYGQDMSQFTQGMPSQFTQALNSESQFQGAHQAAAASSSPFKDLLPVLGGIAAGSSMGPLGMMGGMALASANQTNQDQNQQQTYANQVAQRAGQPIPYPDVGTGGGNLNTANTLFGLAAAGSAATGGTTYGNNTGGSIPDASGGVTPQGGGYSGGTVTPSPAIATPTPSPFAPTASAAPQTDVPVSYDTLAPTQTPVEPPAPAPVAAPAPTPTGTDYNPQLGGAPNGDPTISTTTDPSLFGNLPNVTPTQATIGGAAAAVASGGSGNNQAPAPVPPPAATPVQTPTQPPVIDPFGGTFGAGNTDPNTGLPTASNNVTPTQQAPSPTMPTSNTPTPASNTVDPYGGTSTTAAMDLNQAASSSTPLDATGLSGSSLWDYLTSKPVLGAAGNYLINQSQAQSYADLAKQAASAGNVLNQPQRLPFQQAATSATNDPANWLKTNPFSTSLAAYYKNNVIPQQVAKSGNASNVIDTQGSQFATALAGNYNNYVNTMGTMGGFTQGAGYSAPAMVQAGIPGIQSQGQSYNNASNLLFGLPATNTGTSTNPVSGSQSIFS